jgi:hypothetical protein
VAIETDDPILLAAQEAADPDCRLCDGDGWFHTFDATGAVDGGAICACAYEAPLRLSDVCTDCGYVRALDDPDDMDPCDAHEASLESKGFRF